MPTHICLASRAVLIGLMVSTSAFAETVDLRCRFSGERTGSSPESAELVRVDFEAPRIDIFGSEIDSFGLRLAWTFLNDTSTGDALTLTRSGDQVAGAAVARWRTHLRSI